MPHLLGSQLQACPCGCRSGPLSCARLRSDGLFGVEVVSSWPSQGLSRPCEVGALVEVVGAYQYGSDLKGALSLLVQLASPFQESLDSVGAPEFSAKMPRSRALMISEWETLQLRWFCAGKHTIVLRMTELRVAHVWRFDLMQALLRRLKPRSIALRCSSLFTKAYSLNDTDFLKAKDYVGVCTDLRYEMQETDAQVTTDFHTQWR